MAMHDDQWDFPPTTRAPKGPSSADPATRQPLPLLLRPEEAAVKRGNNEGTVYRDERLGMWRGAISTPTGRR